MKRMTKVLSVLLALVMVFGILPLTAFAGNGPRDHAGSIGFMQPEGDWDEAYPYQIKVYDQGYEVETAEGVAYDKASNTLTLTNFTAPMFLNIVSMGDDFKIKLVGTNKLDSIYISDGQENGCSVAFIGNGNLTLNEDRDEEFAIKVAPQGGSRPKVTFGSDVYMKLWASGGQTGGIACVEQALDDDNNTPVFVFENGQAVNVQQNDSLSFIGDVEGYVLYDHGEGWYQGKMITNPADPDGIYTYSENCEYNEETGDYEPTEFVVQRYNEIVPGAYKQDWEYNGARFKTEEELFANYPPITEERLDDYPSTLYNRIGRIAWSPMSWLYEDEHGTLYVKSDVYNPDTDEYEDMACTYEEIPELPGRYVATPAEGVSLDDLTATDDYISTYTLGDDGNPGHCGSILDVETPEGYCYTVSYTEHQFEDPSENYSSWDVHQFVYSSEYDFWFQDYSFNGGDGDIQIAPADWEDENSELSQDWNHLLYEYREFPVELVSQYGVENFWGSLCENNDGDRIAIYRGSDLNDPENPIFTFEEADSGVLIFTENDEISREGYSVLDAAEVIEGVHDYFIFGESLTVVPKNPVQLDSIVNQNKSIKFSWKAFPGAQYYRIYRKAGNETTWKQLYRAPASTLSLTDSDVKSGTTYTYTVRAESGGILSKYNATGKSIVYLDRTTTSVKNAKGGVNVTYGKVAGAKNYRIYRKTGSGSYSVIGTATGTSYTDTSAKSGTSYKYAVRACNGNSMGTYTEATIVRLQNPSFKLATTKNGVKVTITKVTGAAGYIIYRKEGSGKYSQIGKTTSTSFVDKKAASGKDYIYAVKAYKGGDQSAYNEAKILYMASPNVKAVNTKAGPKLTWKKVGGATRYEVYRKTGSGSYKKIGNTKSSVTTYKDMTAKKGTIYVYAVKAYKGRAKSAYKEVKIKCSK
ncbi:MAG: hypothetical protein K5761_03530 [Clostridiales bacterium]|nr:hypothetical protein [Clostridiales bacterium]